MEISVGVLDHYNVSTRKLKETVQFYEDVLGFVNGPRPQFNFPGAWLYSAGHPVLHLNDISQTEKQQQPIQVSSIMSLSAAAASKPSGSISRKKGCRFGSIRSRTAPAGRFSSMTRITCSSSSISM